MCPGHSQASGLCEYVGEESDCGDGFDSATLCEGDCSVCGPHAPSREPTFGPTRRPTDPPTRKPTVEPTHRPTDAPTRKPTSSPSMRPTTSRPSLHPTFSTKPTVQPTWHNPTLAPTPKPTPFPSHKPSLQPTIEPTMSVGVSIMNQAFIIVVALVGMVILVDLFHHLGYVRVSWWPRSRDTQEIATRTVSTEMTPLRQQHVARYLPQEEDEVEEVGEPQPAAEHSPRESPIRRWLRGGLTPTSPRLVAPVESEL